MQILGYSGEPEVVARANLVLLGVKSDAVSPPATKAEEKAPQYNAAQLRVL